MGIPRRRQGAVADYIPAAEEGQSAVFGVSLAPSTATSTRFGDSAVPFTIQVDLESLRFCAGAGMFGSERVEAVVGVGRARRLQSIRLRPDNRDKSDGQFRRHRLLRFDPQGQGRRSRSNSSVSARRFAGRELGVDEQVFLSGARPAIAIAPRLSVRN